MSKSDTLAPVAAPLPDAPPGFIISTILWLNRCLHRLADKLLPPEAVLFDRIIGIGYTQILGALVRYEIPDHLAEGPLDTATLAARTGLDKDALHRVMRAAVTAGIFAFDKSTDPPLARLNEG